jgi:AraC-like DNA-binding protein
MKNKIFKVEKLPFLELRYLSYVTSCDKSHKHNELTITALKSGSLNIEFEDFIDILKPNKLSIVNPHVVHCASLGEVQSHGCYVMYLDKNWCFETQKSLYEDLHAYLHVNITLLQSKEYHEHFIKVCDELFLKDISLLEKEEKIIEFISELFLNYCDKTILSYEDTNSFSLAKEIEKYIDDNFLQEILLEDIALHLGISVVHVLRVFKQKFGLSVHSYVLNKKVHLAKELLTKNLPIAETAQMSGFFDQSHLNRSFKRVFQLTPKEYQKNIFS